MKTVALVFICSVVLFALAYFLLFPRGSFVRFCGPGGRSIIFSSSGVSLEAAPEHFITNGFDHIEPFIARLLVATNHFKRLQIFTPDGNRGAAFTAKDAVVNVGLNLDWRKEPGREAAIRSFFASLAIKPSADYLAGNGAVHDDTRMIEYPVSGNTAEVTTLTRRILHDLCDISPSEALDIGYTDKH